MRPPKRRIRRNAAIGNEMHVAATDDNELSDASNSNPEDDHSHPHRYDVNLKNDQK